MRIVASIDESLAEHRIHIVCVRRFVFFVTADCVRHEVLLVANAALFLCGLPLLRWVVGMASFWSICEAQTLHN